MNPHISGRRYPAVYAGARIGGVRGILRSDDARRGVSYGDLS
ncbi:hypothetical protein [Actinoplanes subtropicus]|nr:hypothetical protein [Actinoplanes subtropicus]